MQTESRNLDILRAVAVLCVYFTHLLANVLHVDELGAPNALGKVGVLMFFVHTSLVLMQSIDRQRGNRLFLSFYIRRAFRIYPLSMLCVAFVAVARIPDMPHRAYQAVSLPILIQNLALVQNFFSRYSITGPLWSLPWEVQMYLFLPAIFVAVSRWKSAKLIICMWLCFVGVRLAAGPLSLPDTGYYIEYIPYFLCGILAYQLKRTQRPHLAAKWWPLVVIMFPVTYASLWIVAARFPRAHISTLCGFALCLVLGLCIPMFHEPEKSLLTTTSHIIARYSYGIYLTHVPIMWFVFVKLPHPRPLQYVELLVLSAVIPWIIYHTVEEPMIRCGRVFARGWKGRGLAQPVAVHSLNVS